MDINVCSGEGENNTAFGGMIGEFCIALCIVLVMMRCIFFLIVSILMMQRLVKGLEKE